MTCVGDSRPRPHWAGELLVVALLLLAYDRVADLAQVRATPAVAHARALLRWETSLHLSVERHLVDLLSVRRLLGQVTSLYYDLAHAAVTMTVLVCAYLLAPEGYRAARRALVATNLLALTVFLALPVAPPRLVPGAGFVDVIARSGTWGSWSGSPTVLRHADEFASLPSLHVAWALWVLLVVRTITGRRFPRLLALAHVAVTGTVVIVTGNHYVVDVLAGGALALLTWTLCRDRLPTPVPGGVLVVTASMGAGHDGVAYELARRWRAQGTPVTVVDFLHLLPFGLGPGLRRFYGLQLRRAPGTYEWLYAAIERRPSLNWAAGVVAGWTRRRLLRAVRHGRHRLVVATYPLAGRALGQLRREGRLKVPAATFLTDVDVHATWLDRGTDLYLAVYEGSARAARGRTGRAAVTTGPVLPPEHDRPITAQERSVARTQQCLAPGDRTAVLVLGSWGVGAAATAAAALRDSGAVPIVLCGRNRQLRDDLVRQGIRAIGWTDDVRSLYAAADVVVHNAGGLSSLEAFGAGVPVVGHACLPGHGRRNAQAMADAGLAALAADEGDLVRLVHALAQTDEGAQMSERARALFRADVTTTLDALEPTAPVPARRPRAVRLAALTALVPVALTLTNLGVSEATTKGLAVARPPHSDVATVYVAVALDAAELADPATRGALAGAGVSAVVPAAVASADPVHVRALRAIGVTVLAAFPRLPRRPGSARATCRRARDQVSLAAAEDVPSLVAVHGLGAWQLASAYRAHLAVSVATPVRSPADVAVHRGEQVVVDVPNQALQSTLGAVLTAASVAGLEVEPLGRLWRSP